MYLVRKPLLNDVPHSNLLDLMLLVPILWVVLLKTLLELLLPSVVDQRIQNSRACVIGGGGCRIVAAKRVEGGTGRRSERAGAVIIIIIIILNEGQEGRNCIGSRCRGGPVFIEIRERRLTKEESEVGIRLLTVRGAGCLNMIVRSEHGTLEGAFLESRRARRGGTCGVTRGLLLG